MIFKVCLPEMSTATIFKKQCWIMASLVCLFTRLSVHSFDCSLAHIQCQWKMCECNKTKIPKIVSIRISMNTIKICFNFILLYSTPIHSALCHFSHSVFSTLLEWECVCVQFWSCVRLVSSRLVGICVFAVSWAKSAFRSLFNWNWNVFIAFVVCTILVFTFAAVKCLTR